MSLLFVNAHEYFAPTNEHASSGRPLPVRLARARANIMLATSLAFGAAILLSAPFNVLSRADWPMAAYMTVAIPVTFWVVQSRFLTELAGEESNRSALLVWLLSGTWSLMVVPSVLMFMWVDTAVAGPGWLVALPCLGHIIGQAWCIVTFIACLDAKWKGIARVRAGRCPACEYELGALETTRLRCTECGWHSEKGAAMWREDA
jgi:hypothetical protein